MARNSDELPIWFQFYDLLRNLVLIFNSFSSNAGYALSSVEGRVAMEFFDLSDSGQSKKYVFFSTI